MRLLKFTGDDSNTLIHAARQLANAAAEENKQKKLRESAKVAIASLLLKSRDVDVSTLPDKETVLVQCDGVDTVKIDRKSSQRFDAKSFSLVHAVLSLEFTKASVATYFDSLLPVV